MKLHQGLRHRLLLLSYLSWAGVILLWLSLLSAPADEPVSGDATSETIKSKLTQVFRDDFNRPDGKSLSPGWTEASHYGVVNEQLRHHRLRFDIPDGHDIPWGSATLDLSNRLILGRGLEVGEYFEFGMRRLSQEGGLGVELFDSDQLRVGSDLKAGSSALQAWNGKTWVPLTFENQAPPVKYEWNNAHTVGVRFDSADGHHAAFSYYIDGHYAGSWLIATANKTLDKIGVYVQSRTGGAAFEFYELRVYGNPRPVHFMRKMLGKPE